MPRQRHEARHDDPITVVFSALVRALGRHRWADELATENAAELPVIGRSYVHRNGTVVRHGRVVECARPVSLTLYESLFDPPCRVRLRYRWRLEPLDSATLVLLDARYELNRPAYLNRKHWHAQIDAHCGRLFLALGANLADLARQGAAGVNGQRSGSSNMTVMKTTTVNGKPSFK
ncbi:MAG TPA: hypothetical protein VGC50_16825 [Gammaproteobacteria bacterium]